LCDERDLPRSGLKKDICDRLSYYDFEEKFNAIEIVDDMVGGCIADIRESVREENESKKSATRKASPKKKKMN